MRAFDRYSCEQVFRRLDDYLDRELSPIDAEQVRKHLEACEVCAKEYAFQRGVIDQVRGKLTRLSAPPALLSRIGRLLDTAAIE